MKSRFLCQLYLAVAYWLSACVVQAQIQTAWMARYDGELTIGTNQPVAMALDPGGNIVLGINATSANGDWDYLVVKYSPLGTRLWAQRYASPGMTNDQIRGMALDQEGSVYETGTSSTIKYNNDGAQLWIAPYGGRGIALDTTGHAYVTGFLPRGTNSDFSTVKLDATGSNIWVRTYDRIGRGDGSDAIGLNEAGEVFVAGQTSCIGPPTYESDLTVIKYSSDGGQLAVWNLLGCILSTIYGTGVQRIIAQEPAFIIVVGNIQSSFNSLKVNNAGTVVWRQGDGLPPESEMAAATVDPLGNVYLTGRLPSRPWNYTTLFGTMKVDSDGNKVWVRRYGEIAAKGNAIDVDPDGNCLVAGYVPAVGSRQHALLTNDFATIKYDPNGNEVWVERYNGPFNGDDQATAIAVDPARAVYVAGFSQTSPTLTELVLIKYAELENIQRLENGTVRLQFFARPGATVHFESSTNLPSWEPLGSSVTDPDGICRFVDTNASTFSQRFYRRATSE